MITETSKKMDASTSKWIKKHLKKTDKLKIAKKRDCSYAHVCNVLNMDRHNDQIVKDLISAATEKENKPKKDEQQ